MINGTIKADSLIEWLEDKYFDCDNPAVDRAVDEIIEKVHWMAKEDPPKKEKPDFFEDFREKLLAEEE